MLRKLPIHPTVILQWLVNRPGYLLLAGSDEQIRACPPDRFTHAWAGLLVVSTGWSIGSIVLWVLCWRLFGEPFGRIMPALAVVAVGVLWLYRRALVGAVEILFGPDTTARAIAASVWVLAMTLVLVALKRNWRMDSPLPAIVDLARPWEKIFRVLILAPLWGAWSMLITPQFHRPGPATEPAIAAFAKGCGALKTTVVMGLLLALTINYFNFLPWEQLSISGVTIAAAVAAGALFCRKDGALTRRALLAGNLLTQLVFLLSYLAAQNLLLWR